MTRRRALFRAALPIVAALALSGCTAASAPGSAATDAGPLDEYFDVLYGDERSESEQAATTAAIEEAIAACMNAEGFEYFPQPYSPLDDGQPGDWRPDDRDWVSQWGYGVIAFPAMDDVIADNAAGDANDVYYAGLSASEQSAYSTVRWGPAPSDQQIADNLAGLRTITWAEQGCFGQGRHDVVGDDPQDLPEHAEIARALSQFRQGQFDAPDYAELDAEWADCMADAGHGGLTRQDDARQSIDDARYELAVAQNPAVDMGDPIFDDLGVQEVELALADLDCREQVDYRARADAIRDVQEQQFLDDHREELDALLADAEQGG